MCVIVHVIVHVIFHAVCQIQAASIHSIPLKKQYVPVGAPAFGWPAEFTLADSPTRLAIACDDMWLDVVRSKRMARLWLIKLPISERSAAQFEVSTWFEAVIFMKRFRCH